MEYIRNAVHVADFVFINCMSVGRSVFIYANPICIIFITSYRMGIPQQVIIFILHLNINTESQLNIAAHHTDSQPHL